MLAAKVAPPVVIEYLLMNGADPNILNYSDLSPLSALLKRLGPLKSHRIYSSACDLITLFLAAGANINWKEHPPLSYACFLLNRQLVMRLLRVGAPVDLVSELVPLINFNRTKNGTLSSFFLKDTPEGSYQQMISKMILYILRRS